jgi:GNAT superfamily N-acetyltransferase
VIEVRQEPPDGPAARALWDEYMALVAERAGVRLDARTDIFGTPDELTSWVVLYEDGRPVGGAGLREAEPGVAEIKRMFVTAAARRRGHGRRLLAELERVARERGYPRVRLLATDLLPEAVAMYQATGYTIVARPTEDERHDYVMEKVL